MAHTIRVQDQDQPHKMQITVRLVPDLIVTLFVLSKSKELPDENLQISRLMFIVLTSNNSRYMIA